jgi:hypothetical protein
VLYFDSLSHVGAMGVEVVTVDPPFFLSSVVRIDIDTHILVPKNTFS